MITRFNTYDEDDNVYRDDSGDYVLYSDCVEAQQTSQQLITQLTEALQRWVDEPKCASPGCCGDRGYHDSLLFNAKQALDTARQATATPTQTQPAGEG